LQRYAPQDYFSTLFGCHREEINDYLHVGY